MGVLVADTSALVSLGIATTAIADGTLEVETEILACCLSRYEVLVPDIVHEELREVAAFEDEHGRTASAVIDRRDGFATRSVDLDEEFPLDAGENAAVALANEVGAVVLLCD